MQQQKELKCTGCGVEIQTENSVGIGFLSKLKLESYYKKQKELEEVKKKGSITQGLKGSDKHIVEYLRDKNVSEEVLMEFTRS